ncbi:hypothetical protein, partial [Candidatus Oleimmundimicrobium sp.]|uniref:hypothetical protein n=1 Tax=Candidatus Oleimmundimicrobium sp. TaxID=3060597 RepID=UPI002719D78C
KFVGTKEFAEIMGWSSNKVASYLSMVKKGTLKADFPVPVQRLACGAIWKRKDVLEYKENRRKKEDERD